ncbi:sensor domain-containing diguanylate cyclase [Pseudomonas matsuisoli]|uniref:diguanylate cyclase n=2 Tax=Pseudomonas matsuisoli TaxID=1515666 RepID=A0A917UQY9_9PSED|nr:sensor domain-containing diguanylate cyclase [Pseudomonas matsuisoli]
MVAAQKEMLFSQAIPVQTPQSKIGHARRLVVIMAGFISLAVILLTYVQVTWDKRVAVEQHVEEVKNLSTALTLQAESTIRDAHTVLLSIQAKLALSGYTEANFAEIRELSRVQLGVLRELESFAVADADGAALMTTVETAAAPFTAADREFFAYHRITRNPSLYIGSPIRSRLTGNWVIPLSLRLNDPEGNFRGVALASLNVQRFIDFYQEFDLGPEGSISLFKRDGYILARSRMPAESIGINISKSPVLQMMNEHGVPRGTLTAKSVIDGMTRIYGFDASTRYPIAVAAAISEHDALTVWRSRAMQAWLLSAITLVIFTGMTALIWRALTRQERMETRLQAMHSELAQANLTLEVIASEDALTRLANRRKFDETLDTAFRSLRSRDRPMALLLIDVDYFKRFNDGYGHPEGDEALKRVADVLRQSIRNDVDTAARYGGEEFALILPTANAESAPVVAERVRSGVEALRITNEGSPYGTLTVSIGIAVLPSNHRLQDPKDLLLAADKALYAAKAEGRNRIAHQSVCRSVFTNG